MNVIVCVASNREKYTEGFLDEMNKCMGELSVLGKVLVIRNYKVTAPYWWGDWPNLEGDDRVVERDGNPAKRPYSEIMKDKVDFVSEYADDNTVVWMADVDYACNPWALEVMHLIFEERPEIDYLSLIRGPGVPTDGDIEALGIIKLYRWQSMMGGSTMTRWSVFKRHVTEYFEAQKTSNMFDGPLGVSFWPFLKAKYDIKDPVYTMGWPCSLVQHCRMGGSEYGHDRGGKHMYAVNFDPRTNIFEVKKPE